MPNQACKRHDCDLEPRLARIETMVAQVRAVAVVLGIAAGALAITASWSVKHMLLDALGDDEVRAKVVSITQKETP
jgi:hypothetical protein